MAESFRNRLSKATLKRSCLALKSDQFYSRVIDV
jgi:hypothetical protein